MAQPATTRAGDAPQHAVTFNKYDERDLQGKAMREWEKQKRVWATVQENIRRRVENNNTINGAGMNMLQGAYRARIREEEIGMITKVAPTAAFSGPHTWESTLRTTGDTEVIRYLKVGQTNFPYVLYGKITDQWRLSVEHQSNTRVVFPGEHILSEAASTGLQQRPSTAAVPVLFCNSDYYKQRFQQYFPLIEKNMPHLLLPRAYLEVRGQPPPWTTNPEDAAAAAKRSVPAVVHVPPLQPKGGQEQQQQKDQEDQDGMDENGPPSVGKTETMIGSKDINATTVPMEEDAAGAPSLEISTSRILFFARPGELAHGSVQIKNNGTTTVYYSWAPFQPVTALDGERDTDVVNGEKEETTKKQGSDGTVEEATDEAAALHTSSDQQSPASSRQMVKGTPHQMNVPLRSLAKKLAQSKSFFFLSEQLDGVILPDDEKTFSFSVRAAFPGRFLQHYELLMIPVAASRVVVELCAIIQDGGHSFETVFRPVAAALDAKAVVDAQREVINAMAANTNVYEAAEIARATQACLDAAKVSQGAREALVAKWRKAWNSTTYLALRLPFNIDVYERLNALHQNLVQTMLALEQPLHHEEWDGSVQTLQSDLCKLRDAVSRNVLREGLNILLRAATVCELDDEPLDLLLQRVAGMVAFSALAQQTGELDDTVLLSLGLREPHGARNGAHPQTGARGNNNAGGGGAAVGRKGVGGSSSTGSSGGGGSKPQGRAPNKGKGTASADPSPTRLGNTEKSPAHNDANASGDSLAEASLKEEYSIYLFAGMRRLVGDAVDTFCSMLESFRYTMEAACALPLLEVTACVRAEAVRTIQNTDDVEVDFAVDAAPPKKKKK
ncbi:hypothetical protein TraAM80_05407 [Trypanosoma rangeli]|uniref:Uncharacterized protein n=1 Tax=Trypanosoma rangeli TaxID=5698 RepID=A0A422NER2_TRYRA|nr:uncharacterized protein TraAM80_05407 [Trypanosoma rangeli]RNF03953.1 hypothetical protein TraAM80_05407 [Trypanosoma rangeli]|eukprot:RNF03953.1 hypothetical protein TraAM80_05407 [Trypanosoma rangeli]